MRKFVSRAPVVLLVVSLIGCATSQGPSVCEQLGFWKCPPKPVSCNADSLDKGGSWKLGELVLSKTGDTPVSIKGVSYTTSEVRILADSVAELEQLRVSHCQDLQALGGSDGASAQAVQALASEFNTTYVIYKNALTAGVLNAKTKKEALDAATKVKADIALAKATASSKTDELKAGPNAPAAPTPAASAALGAADGASAEDSSASAPAAPDAASAPVADVQQLTDKVLALQGQLDALEKRVAGQAIGPARTRVVLEGFDPTGFELSESARNQAIDQFQKYAQSLSVGRQLNASVVGYADRSGGYLANVELGRRRAQSVADLLAIACDGVRVESVASGGVYPQGGNGRRVEVFLWATRRA